MSYNVKRLIRRSAKLRSRARRFGIVLPASELVITTLWVKLRPLPDIPLHPDFRRLIIRRDSAELHVTNRSVIIDHKYHISGWPYSIAPDYPKLASTSGHEATLTFENGSAVLVNAFRETSLRRFIEVRACCLDAFTRGLSFRGDFQMEDLALLYRLQGGSEDLSTFGLDYPILGRHGQSR